MNKTLKKIVHQYLDNTYKLELEALSNYKVLLKTENKQVPITSMYDDVKELFNMHPYNCGEYFSEWIDLAAIKLNNEAVDDLYDTYAQVRNTPRPPAAAIKLRAISDNIAKGSSRQNNHEAYQQVFHD